MSTVETVCRNSTMVVANSHPALVGNDHFGIEVELENITSSFNNPLWEVKPDGSLRNNGAEFVFRRPLNGVDLMSAVSSFCSFINTTSPSRSWRCSTHFHMNVKDMNSDQLKLLILAFVFYEKFFFKCGCQNRYKNNFCMPFGMAKNQITKLAGIWNLSGSDFFHELSGGSSKYSALNLKPITDFGSVELRIHNAEIDSSMLVAICNRMMVLKNLAMSWSGGNHSEFVEMLKNSRHNQIFHKQISLGVEIEEEDIQDGYIYAMNISSLGNPSLYTTATDLVREIARTEATSSEVSSENQEPEEALYSTRFVEEGTWQGVVESLQTLYSIRNSVEEAVTLVGTLSPQITFGKCSEIVASFGVNALSRILTNSAFSEYCSESMSLADFQPPHIPSIPRSSNSPTMHSFQQALTTAYGNGGSRTRTLDRLVSYGDLSSFVPPESNGASAGVQFGREVNITVDRSI